MATHFDWSVVALVRLRVLVVLFIIVDRVLS